MKESIEKLIGRLEELYNSNDKMKKKAYEEQDWENFELFTHRNEGVYTSISIVNQLAEEYEECFNLCSENCEVYDKEKHYCPKWCKVIKDTVAELKEDCNNGWIPCSERLPEVNTTYLVSLEGYCKPLMAWFGSDKEWYWHNSTSKMDFVIAWQPLPQAYQPKGE